jgi:Resolvase, N terminal domain
LFGYARCSTDAQNLTAQRDRLRELGVAEERIYLDHGLTGTNLYRSITRHRYGDLRFGRMSRLRQDRGLCPFACST